MTKSAAFSLSGMTAGLLCILGMLLGGCGVLGPKDRITISVVNIDTVSSGQSKQVWGIVEAGNNLSLVFGILDSAGNQVTDGTVSCTENSISGKSSVDLQKDVNLKIVAQTTATSGKYYLAIQATADNTTMQAQTSFVVAGGGAPPLVEKSLTLGGPLSSSSSLLDADNMVAYRDSLTDLATQAKIDAVFGSDSTGAPTITSPLASWDSAVSRWAVKAQTLFKDVTLTAHFSSIMTQQQIDALWGTGAGTTSLELSVGQVIVLLTNQGAFKVVQIAALNGIGSVATVGVKGK